MQKQNSFEIWSPQLRNRRNVDVYLPESYGTAPRYPVVYMQDGQNLSDPAMAFAGNTWHLDEDLRLARRARHRADRRRHPQHRSGPARGIQSVLRREARRRAGRALPGVSHRHGQAAHRSR